MWSRGSQTQTFQSKPCLVCCRRTLECLLSSSPHWQSLLVSVWLLPALKQATCSVTALWAVVATLHQAVVAKLQCQVVVAKSHLLVDAKLLAIHAHAAASSVACSLSCTLASLLAAIHALQFVSQFALQHLFAVHQLQLQYAATLHQAADATFVILVLPAARRAQAF